MAWRIGRIRKTLRFALLFFLIFVFMLFLTCIGMGEQDSPFYPADFSGIGNGAALRAMGESATRTLVDIHRIIADYFCDRFLSLRLGSPGLLLPAALSSRSFERIACAALYAFFAMAAQIARIISERLNGIGSHSPP